MFSNYTKHIFTLLFLTASLSSWAEEIDAVQLAKDIEYYKNRFEIFRTIEREGKLLCNEKSDSYNKGRCFDYQEWSTLLTKSCEETMHADHKASKAYRYPIISKKEIIDIKHRFHSTAAYGGITIENGIWKQQQTFHGDGGPYMDMNQVDALYKQTENLQDYYENYYSLDLLCKIKEQKTRKLILEGYKKFVLEPRKEQQPQNQN